VRDYYGSNVVGRALESSGPIQVLPNNVTGPQQYGH
jgi:hypothetical protein